MKLAIISHTEHYLNDKGEVIAWGPTVREINNLTKIFSEVYHIAPLHKTRAPASALGYTSDKIKYIPLVASGGAGLASKIKILIAAPKNLLKVHKVLDKVDYVQFRGPTNLGMYIIPYLSIRKRPKKWFKYAGNWVQQNPPISYGLQRWWLKANLQKSIVTVNGKWPDQQNHIISFENPCITTEELEEAHEIADKKRFDEGQTICFVGRLEEEKGVLRIIETLKLIPGSSIKKVIFVGDGPNRRLFEEMAKPLKLEYLFTGGLSRYKLADVYKESHLFFLPSTASEGFPKVIAEAAAYGCVPVVSNISSIGQFVKNNENGILLENVSPEFMAKRLKDILEKPDLLKYLSSKAVNIAIPFTYDHYNSRIKNEVLPQLK